MSTLRAQLMPLIDPNDGKEEIASDDKEDMFKPTYNPYYEQ